MNRRETDAAPLTRRTLTLLGACWMALMFVVTGVDAADKPAPGDPLKVYILSGSKEYKSEPSLKAFKAMLEKKYKVTCEADWSRDGAKDLPNLDKLAEAELLIIYCRRLKLPEDQAAKIQAHCEAGKPIVGLRTASHAIQTWLAFDKQVLGGDYKGHFGGEPVKVKNDAKHRDHPVLASVKSFTSKKLYKAGTLAGDVTLLQTGDIGKAEHPVTWVRQYKGGRVFYSSLGVPSDFEDDQFLRMLLNAVFWTTHRDEAKMKK